jgi:hypothetical protein
MIVRFPLHLLHGKVPRDGLPRLGQNGVKIRFTRVRGKEEGGKRLSGNFHVARSAPLVTFTWGKAEAVTTSARASIFTSQSRSHAGTTAQPPFWSWPSRFLDRMIRPPAGGGGAFWAHRDRWTGEIIRWGESGIIDASSVAPLSWKEQYELGGNAEWVR